MPAKNRSNSIANPVTTDQVDSLRAVLSIIRTQRHVSRSEIARQLELGRAVVGERVKQLIDLGLIEEIGQGESSGGRRVVELAINNKAGYVLAADLGATSITTGIANASGEILSFFEESADISQGPEVTMDSVCARFDQLIAEFKVKSLWGIGVGLPGPVEFSTGIAVSPPIMPGWDGFKVREFLQKKYNAATWVDNDVNVMALAEATVGASKDTHDSLFVKVGTGIGAGLISQRILHRGAQGAAGDIGHIQITTDASARCTCGNIGCLESIAGGAAIARLGEKAKAEGKSPRLSALSKDGKALSAVDVSVAANAGDHEANAIIQNAGETLGLTLAGLINFYNPEMVVIGGGVSQAGGQYLAAIRQAIYRRSLPLATRDLQVVLHSLGAEVGVTGCVLMVLEELLNPGILEQWISKGTAKGLLV